MNKTSKRVKGILFALAYTAIYGVMQIAVQFLFVLYHRANGYLSETEIYNSLLGGSFAISVIAAVAAFWIYAIIGAFRKRPVAGYIHNRPISPMTVIMVCCAAVGSRCGVNAYYHFAKKISLLKKSIEQADALLPDSLSPYQALIALLTVIVIAPLFEEFLFRFLIMGELSDIMRPWAAVVLQAILFGAAHLSLFQSMFAFIMGILLGVVSLKTKSIKACAILHGVFNFSSVFMTESLTNGTAVILSVFGLLLTASATAYIIVTSGKK